MSKTRIFALLVIAIVLAAILTNPSRQQFETAISSRAKDVLRKQLNYEHSDAVQLGMTLFGDRLVKDFMDHNVVIENYYLFSLVKIKWQDETTPIGGGAFKQVWLTSRIDEKADEIIGTLKKL